MATAARAHFEWHLRTRTLSLGQRTRLMGIVNVTPDSFSDGGVHDSSDAAITHALQLLDDGADVIDIGGESTRPGSAAATTEAMDAVEEPPRVLPVIEGVLRQRPDAVLSIDTYHASTARLAMDAGAEIANDVSGGLWDAALLRTCAELQCGMVVMHTRGLPSAWASQTPLAEEEVVRSVVEGLRERLAAALAAGIARERIVVDPGFGFGKRGEENWALLAGLDRLHELGLPLLVGLSRKGFLDPSKLAAERDDATHAANKIAVQSSAHILRVHDVRGAVLTSAAADARTG